MFTGSGRDTRADFNDLGMLLKAAQCQEPSGPDWIPHSARRKSLGLYLQTSVDNIKPGGHDLSLQGSQIRLYLVSHFLNHVRSRSHMLTPSFFVSLGTCMTVGLRILLAESFKATAGDRCIILIEVHESCVLNSPCCLGSFFAVADVPIPLEHCDPNNMHNQHYQTDELLILPCTLV